jgi:hypothetical protein
MYSQITKGPIGIFYYNVNVKDLNRVSRKERESQADESLSYVQIHRHHHSLKYSKSFREQIYNMQGICSSQDWKITI